MQDRARGGRRRNVWWLGDFYSSGSAALIEDALKQRLTGLALALLAAEPRTVSIPLAMLSCSAAEALRGKSVGNRQPAFGIVGEIFAGAIAGPQRSGWVEPTNSLSELGVMFLLCLCRPRGEILSELMQVEQQLSAGGTPRRARPHGLGLGHPSASVGYTQIESGYSLERR